MYLKIIVFITTLCAVNASVITITTSIADDDSSLAASKDSSSLRSCNPLECDQLCRRLKFPGGVCVNGRCKCDNFVSSQDAVQRSADLDASTSLRDCNPLACDQLCRRLQFPGGVCVNGRCKCDNFLSSQDAIQGGADLEGTISLRDCNPLACDQLCRRLGFPGGVCVNGRCKCDNFLTSEDAHVQRGANLEDTIYLRDCNPLACDQLCRRLQFPGGVCVNGRCKCDNFLSSEDAVSRFADFRDSITSLQSCNNQECDQRCRRLKFPGGICVNGRCKCDNFLTSRGASAGDTVSYEGDESDLFSKDAEDTLLEDSKTVFEPTYSIAVHKCKPGLCDRLCRFLEFDSGTCINDRCTCNKKESSPVDEAVAEEGSPIVREGNTRRIDAASCYQYLCNDQCIRKGYAGGLCKKNKTCKCY